MKLKTQPFAKVLFGLGIRHVGETVAKRLAQHFGSMMALSHATQEELLVVEDIGEKIVESLHAYFAIHHQKMVQDLTTLVYQWKHNNKSKLSKLAGKTIVVSGFLKNYLAMSLKNHRR